MIRNGFKMKLIPGMKDEYKRRHDQIWPELTQLIKQSGICDYSIFFDKDTNMLFAVQKQNENIGSQDLGNNIVVQKWWAYMADIMETNSDNSPKSFVLEEVFYLE